MLFTSYIFILLFLPIVFGMYCLLAPRNHQLARIWLILASLFFYAWWNPKFVLLLLASAGMNYFFGVRIARARPSSHARHLLTAGVVLNLLCLGYFKYANFFIANYNALAGSQLAFVQVTLPLGISFYTFTQLAFLIDVYRGIAVEFRFPNYLLFVTYFPHLIAGPILHHKQMMPQFADRNTYRVRSKNLAIGLTFFCLGLLKKLYLADSLGAYADASFGASAHGSVSFLTAWVGALAYTFQLYFDFSGYCDMAIGISWFFGIQLPINFNSPYKAPNIIDFWRRWHITLSNFLRDYVYISLGGNRKGKVRRHLNLMATMFIGGLWHGASWTFVVWGSLHGALLVVNHLWNDFAGRWNFSFLPGNRLVHGCSVVATFFCVTLLWVFFRAPTFTAAGHMLDAMAGQTGGDFPRILEPFLQGPLHAFHITGIRFIDGFHLEGGPQKSVLYTTVLWILAIGLTFFCWNSQEIVARLTAFKSQSPFGLLLVHGAWGAVLGVFFCLSLAMTGHKSVFLYFQF